MHLYAFNLNFLSFFVHSVLVTAAAIPQDATVHDERAARMIECYELLNFVQRTANLTVWQLSGECLTHRVPLAL